MSANTHSMHRTARPQSRRLFHPSSPRLHYKHLAFGIGLALGSLLFCGAASAAQGVPATTSPTGGKVIGGVGSITQHGAETIVRQKSKLLSLDWKTFNVGKDASVLFKQPSFRAVALNRILDQNPSRIFGKISSNGQVFLINTHGIIFGASAQLNVGGLVASTLDLTPQDFLKKHFSLDAHGGHAGIVNHGTLAAASGGSISLIGGHVVNDGLIVANYGHINLDGADKAVLSFDDAGLINVEITGKLKQRFDADRGAVVNKGGLHAQGGTVVLKAAAAKHLFTNLVNNSGVIEARGIRTDGGVVRLVGSGGNVMNSGSIDVSGVHGGSAQLLSDRNVGVVAGTIDASGVHGGGDIRVGGGWQGGEGLQTASATYVAPDATLNADATQSGDGGSVVVWGNNVNNFYGSISARGGALGGDGGRAETSSHYGLNVQGRVDMAAPQGQAGTWLLDPYNLDISYNNSGVANVGANFFAVADNAVVDATSIGTALDADISVFVFTGSGGSQAGNITVHSPIVAGGTGTLYLQAAGSIFIDKNISAAGPDQPLNVYLWANYGSNQTLQTTYESRAACPTCKIIVGDTTPATIWTAGGDVHIQTGDATNIGGALQVGSGDLFTGMIDTSGTSTYGALDVKTTGISQQGAGSTITAGATNLDAGSGSVDLANPGNNFTQAVRLTSVGSHVVLVNNRATVLGSGTVAGTLDVTSNGALTQTGALSVTGDATFTQSSTTAGASQDMDLGSQANDFQSGVTFAAGTGAQIHDLLLKNIDASPGTLALPAHVGGDMTLDYTGAALVLPALDIGGALKVTAGSGITLNGDITTGDMQTYNNTVDLNGGDTTLTGTQVMLNGVNGNNHSLTVAGYATLNGVLAGINNLDVIGATALGASDVSTAGTQFYEGALALNGGDTALTGARITLQGVTGNHHSLTLTGETTLNGALTNVSDLKVLGPTILGVADVSTTGTQFYDGAIALNGGDTTLTGTQITLQGIVGGNHSLTLTGETTLNGALTNVGDLKVVGATTLGIADVSTTGTQFYDGALALDGGDTTLTGTQITLRGVTGHNHSLTVDGDAALNGVLTDVDNLEVTGITALGLTGVKTTGTQNYGGTLSLNSGNTILTGTQITLQGVTGHSYSLAIAGNATLNGALAGINDLDVTGTTVLGATDVNTAGKQLYEGALMLDGGDTALTGTRVTLQGVTGNHHSLTLTGKTTLNGALTNVSDLKVVGPTILGVADVSTTGTQNYGGAIALNGGDTMLTGTQITLQDVVGGNRSLTLAGDTTLNGALTSVSDLKVVGTTTLGVKDVSTTGTQFYDGALVLNSGDTTLTGMQVTLQGVTGHSHSLTVAGNATLNGALAGINNLDVTGTTVLGATDVNTAGKQLYKGALALNGGDTALTGTRITLQGVTGNNHSLTLTGKTTLNGALTTVSDLKVIGPTILGVANVSTTGTQIYEGALALNGGDTALTGTAVTLNGVVGGNRDLTITGDATLSGSLTSINHLTVTGTTAFHAASVNTGGTQDYQGAVTLTGGTTLLDASGGNGAVNFDATVDNAGSGAAQTLVVKAGTGQITFGDTVGGLQGPLDGLTVNGGTLAAQDLHIGAGGLSVTTTAGDLVQTGAFTVDGASSFNVGAHAITLNDKSNHFIGPVSLTNTGGHDVYLDNGGHKLTLGALSLGSGALSLVHYGSDPLLLSDSITTHGGKVHFGGAVTVDGSSAAGGTIAIDTTGGGSAGANIIFDGDVNGSSLGSDNLSVDAGSAGTVSFGGDVGNSVMLGNLAVTGKSLNLPGTLAVAGDLSVTTVDALTTGTDWKGANVSLATTGSNNDLTLAGNVTASNGTVKLASKGGIHQSGGAMTAGTLIGSSAGATVLTGNNAVASLGGFSANGFSLTNGQALTVSGAIDAGTGSADLTTTHGALTLDDTVHAGAITLDGAGGLALNAAVDSGSGATDLVSGGKITENGSGTIAAGALTGRSAGATSLTGNNAIANLGAFSANGFSLINTQALTVTDAVSGDAGAMDLTTTHGALTIKGTVDGAAVVLDGHDGLAINAAVSSAGVVTLNTGGAIAETGKGAVTAASLTGRSAGATHLDGANTIGSLGDFSADGFRLTNAASLAVDGTVDGGTGGTALTVTTGDLAINGTLGNTGSATLLKVAGAIGQDSKGVVKANMLSGSSTGAASLTGNNQVASLGDFTADGFDFTDARALTVAAGSTVDGGKNGIALTVTNGDLSINGTLGNMAGTTTLVASQGAIGEGTGGVVKAQTLTGSSQGDTRLRGNNRIDTLAAFSARNLALTDAHDLSVVGPVSTANGKGDIAFTTTTGNKLDVGLVLTGGAITLDSGSDLNVTNDIKGAAVNLGAHGSLAIDATVDSGAGTTTLTQKGKGTLSEGPAGSIIAGTLTGRSTGGTTLNGTNAIANLGNFTAKGFALTNGRALTLAAGSVVDGGSSARLTTTGTDSDVTIDGILRGDSTRLVSTGAIGEGAGGSVQADTLSGRSAGATALTGTNAIGTLGNFTAAGFALTNGQTLTVADGAVVDGGSTATLRTTGANSDLAIDGTVKGTHATLVSAGGIDEGAHGAVLAGTLTGRSVAATSLTGANAVASLGDFSAHGLVLNDTRSLTVADGASVNGGHAVRLATTGSGSNLTINGRVTGTATHLDSAGAIREGSGGSIHATTLAGRSAGATKLIGTNAIGSLGDFTATSLALTNGRALTIAAGATVDGGAQATLTTTGKNSNLALNGTLKSARTALRVAGAIKQGKKGVLDTGVLTGKSVGSTTLTGNNAVAKLGNFSADGFALTTRSGLAVTAGSTVNGHGSTVLTTTGSGHDLDIGGTVAGDSVELASAGAIGEGSAGQVRAGTLTGHSVGDTALTGANRVDSLGAFQAKDFKLTNARALVVGGPLTTTHSAGDIDLTTTGGTGHTLTVKQAIHGGAVTLASAGDLTVANAVTGTEVNLAANGNLAIDAAVDSGSGTTTLTQKGAGAIRGGAHGRIAAGTLTGSATGATTLGSSAQFMDNRVDVLGGFSSPAGFSFTNGRSLTLAAVNGSAFTVDAGQSDLYLGVRNGDLLQNGTDWLYDGTGTWSASGHIGLATAPIYVTGVGNQTVAAIGKPPAYFYAVGVNGNLLPLTGGSSVNIPTANLSSRSQNTTGHTDRYIDISVITAIYRSYGVVPPGILLPPDRWLCSLNRPSLGGCPENN